jgi:hypothetical protein
MNNFLDLQDTELELDLILRICPVGCPRLKVSINDDVYEWNAEHPFLIQRQLPLLDPFLIKIELLEKDYTAAQETAAVIEQLSIDKIELVPTWTQLAQYHNDHNYHDPTNYLGFVGAWTLSVDRPFYQWWHSATGQGLLLTLNQK